MNTPGKEWKFLVRRGWCVGWQDYINKLTHLLLAAEEDRSGAVAAQIREMVESQRWAVQCFMRNDMSKLMKISNEVRRDSASRFRPIEAARSQLVRSPLASASAPL